MSRETTLIFLALLAALSPFLGLPYAWLMVLLPIVGLSMLAIAVVLRIHRLRSNEPIPASVSIPVTSDETNENA